MAAKNPSGVATRDIRSVLVHASGRDWGTVDDLLDVPHHCVGRNGLGVHFVLCNGNAVSGGNAYDPEWDGKIQEARPVEQAGFHSGDAVTDTTSVAILLVGSGDGRYTPMQISALENLIHLLKVDTVASHECAGFDAGAWWDGD